MYLPTYKNSWALIIGINSYPTAPLSYDRQDAEAIQEILINRFEFNQEHIIVLFDKDATRSTIMDSFLRFAKEDITTDDRILIFYAGHGYTHNAKRGEVGYLVPIDGDPKNLASMIRWDELTRNADLIHAKHIFFIMDACYGGLAITRSPGPGSMRFLKSMLQRFSRQVLTAGKANEVVSDTGGPIPGHSVFTGHLLQALEGKAASPDGVICANNIMAYVYEKVAKDINSRQTPHFGFIDGDGDFIFKASILESLLDEKKEDKDVLIETIPTFPVILYDNDYSNLLKIIKEYIPDLKYRIKLDDLVTAEIRKVLSLTADENFPLSIDVSMDEFINRLKTYEEIVKILQSILILLAYWGFEEHKTLIRKIIERIIDDKQASGGKVTWLALRFYPSSLLLYSGGIAAISSQKYENLFTMFSTRIGPKYSGEARKEILQIVIEEAVDLERTKIFKTLPGYERNFVPRSEYLFKVLQPVIDDLLFLGNRYEEMFDRFEVFLALVYADLDNRRFGNFWGPLGRFAYKHKSRGMRDKPFTEIINEAKYYDNDWAPLKAGFFNGSYERFNEVSTEFEKLINQTNWH